MRFAVDAYVNFARTQPWPIAVASSLTELFAPDLMATRLAAFERHYTWVQPWGFDYFKRRLTQARRDSAEGLALTIEHCKSGNAGYCCARAVVQMRCALGDPRCDPCKIPPIDLQSRPALARHVRLQIDPVGGGPVLLYPEGLLKLNETAHEILSRCDGRTTVEGIINLLGMEYEADAETLREDVIDCLAQFQREQLSHSRHECLPAIRAACGADLPLSAALPVLLESNAVSGR